MGEEIAERIGPASLNAPRGLVGGAKPDRLATMMQVSDNELAHILHGAEWSLHCVSPLAPAALLAPVSGHPLLRGVRSDDDGIRLGNPGPSSALCQIWVIAPGGWMWDTFRGGPRGAPDPSDLWSVTIDTDWRMGQNVLGEDPYSLLLDMAAKTDALIAVESGRAPGDLRHLAPGFAAETLGLDGSERVLSLGDAAFDPKPLIGLCTPVSVDIAPDLRDRQDRAGRAVAALLNDPSLGPAPSPV